MIFVEKSAQELRQEIRYLLTETDAKSLEYVAGAVQALEWVLAGGLPPSSYLTKVKEKVELGESHGI